MTLLLLLWEGIARAQVSPQLHSWELYFGTENVPSNNQLTFTVESQGPEWDGTFYLSSGYPGGSVNTWGTTKPSVPAGFDFLDGDGSICGGSCVSTCCYGGVLGYGVYKISCSDGGYFYLDYTDDDYHNSYGVAADIFILYDDSENEFYWSSDYTGGNLGTYKRIVTGNTVGVWTMWGYSGPQDQSKFQPTTPTNLTVSWNSDYTHPFLQWDASSPSLAALYNIYRRTRSGSYQQIASNYGSTTYLDAQVGCGLQTCYYKVIAVSGDESKQSPSYVEKSFSATCAAPIGQDLTSGSSNNKSALGPHSEASSVGFRRDKPLGLATSWTQIQPNNLWAFLSNGGAFFESNTLAQPGISWVTQGNNSLVFTSGLWIAGVDKRDTARDVLGYYDDTNVQPGVITQTFSDTNVTSTFNPFDPRFEIAVVSDTSTLSDTSYQRWVENAAVTGAPMNQDGTPKLFGKINAYWVMNDLDTTSRSGMVPMGVEVHCYVFGIDTVGALSDAIFVLMDVINRSFHTYDSTYLGWFSDIDIGNAFDDLPGCDTLLSLGYMYNGGDTDYYYGRVAPACGFVILAGPSKTAANSSMTSFNKNDDGSLVWELYPQGAVPTFSQQILDVLAGRHHDGSPFINPDDSSHIITYVDPGDPVTGKGWIATLDQPPADNRFLQGSGPFTFVPGDTEKFVVAFIAARDTSRLSSITKLKESVPAIVSKWNEIKDDVVGVNEKRIPLPADFNLSQNFPNPFNPSTVIGFQLPVGGKVTLKVYDVLGREVKTLMNTFQAPGNHDVTFDACRLSSGVYFYRLVSGSYTSTKKMLLMK